MFATAAGANILCVVSMRNTHANFPRMRTHVSVLGTFVLISAGVIMAAVPGYAAISIDTSSTTGGSIRPGNDTDACTAGNAGAIRSVGGALSSCNGSAWRSLGPSAAGSTGQVQFNNAGAFAASGGLAWDETNWRLNIGPATTTARLNVSIASGLTSIHGNNASAGIGVHGNSSSGVGVHGTSNQSQGIYGHSNASYGMLGYSDNSYGVGGRTLAAGSGGVIGLSQDQATYGILGYSNRYSMYGVGELYNGGAVRLAGMFNGQAYYSVCADGSLYLYYHAGACSAASDRRLKTDIAPVAGSLEQLMRIRGVSYRWKDKRQDSRLRFGVIAQEVEAVFPNLVNTDPSSTIKSVDYQGLIAPLIEAVKKLKADNDRMQRQLDAVCRETRSC